MVESCIKSGESPLFKLHPTDLSKFIMCDRNGMLFEMHCPAGTLFDAQLKICNHNYGSTSCGDCEITNEIGDSIAPEWLTEPKKPTTTSATTIKPLVNVSRISQKLVLTQPHTYSRKPGNFNGTISFEIDIMKNSSPINLNLGQT